MGGGGGGQNSPGPGFKPLCAMPLIGKKWFPISAFDNYTSLRAQIVIANAPKYLILALFSWKHGMHYFILVDLVSGCNAYITPKRDKIINIFFFFESQALPGIMFCPRARAGSGRPWNFPSVKATNILFSPHHTTPCLYMKIYFDKYSEHN